MKRLLLKFGGLTALVSLGLLTAYFVAGPVAAAPGGGTCVSGGTKLDFSAESYTINAPAGSVITAVYVKAGTQCIKYELDSAGPCYAISGIGTSTVTINRIGSGSTCKSISHVEYVTAPGTTTTTTTTTTSTTTPTTSTTTTTP